MQELIKHSVFFFFCLVVISCNNITAEDKSISNDTNQTTPTETEDNWIYLFDGKDASGWRSFNGTELPSGWIVEDGCLKSLGKGGDIGGDIVYGAKEFENFELSLKWKISKAGNSGIFYHVQEGEQYNAAYENAPEYQVLDDIGYPDPLKDWQQVGADYAMHPADPEKKIVKPHGEWNSSKIIFTPEKVKHYLNGEKIVEFVPWDDAWKERVANCKWKDYPDYGKAKKGLIGLQDHGSFIWYKDIKIKEL